MKKYLALFLAFILLSAVVFTMASCEKEPAAPTTPDGEEIPVIDTGDVENNDQAHSAPGSSYFYVRTDLTLDGDPVYADGKLTLNFNEAAVYAKDSNCYIGLQSDTEADSIKAAPDMNSVSDMYNGDGAYTGIVLVPESPLTPGTYNVFVSIDAYVVETFEYTIK